MKRMIRLPRTAMLLLAWLYFSSPAHAQDATWIGRTSDWNTGTNWRATRPTTMPTVPTGTATFDATGITKSLTFSAAASIGTLQFNEPGYIFAIANFQNAPLINTIAIIGSGIKSPPLQMRRRSMLPIRFSNSQTRARLARRFSTSSIQVPWPSLTIATLVTRQSILALQVRTLSPIPTDSRAVSYSSGAAARLQMRRSQVFGLRTSNFKIRAKQVMRQSPPP